MSNIWNPHAFGVTGQPVGPQVNTLRVYGVEPSKEQLAMAQQAFAKFCMTDRLSFAPNQTQQGFLPDGSKYRIVTVGNTRIMEVRVEGSDTGTGYQRGVGVEALFSGSPTLFILTFLNDVWRVKRVEEFYGGSGLWVGTSGRYLTDDSLASGAVVSTTRRFRPGAADLPTPIFSTSVLRGLAYGHRSTNGVGVFTRGGKYAVVSPSPFSLSAEIREAALLPENEFAKTPEEPAALTPFAPAVTVSVAPQPGLQLLGLQSGRGGYTRLRDASAVVFPVIDNLRPLGPDVGPWLAGAPITHEFWVELRPDGGYSARLTEVSDPGDEEWLPSEPGASFTEWESTYVKRMDNTLDSTVTSTTVTFPGGARSTPYTWGHDALRSFVGQYKRSFESDRTVYMGRDWSDKPVVMTLENSEEYTADIDRVGMQTFKFSSITLGGIDPPHLVFPPGFVVSNVPPLEMDRPWGGYAVGYTTGEPEQGGYSESGEVRIDYRIKKGMDLKAPWGQTLKLLDQDVTYTQVRVGNMHLSECTVSASATGRSIHREVKFIDPLLRVVAFVELEAGGFTASGNVMGTTDSTAKFIIQCAGSELLAFDLPAPNEQFVWVGSPPDIFSGFMSFSSWWIDWESAGSRVSRPLSFPGQYVYLEPGGVRVYVDYTRTLETGPLDYYETSTAPRLLATASLPTTRAPRPTMPGTGFGVSVRAAIDPNSGGGVVVVHDGETFKGGWAIAPNGAVTVLAAHLRRNGVAPEHIQKLAVSV